MSAEVGTSLLHVNHPLISDGCLSWGNPHSDSGMSSFYSEKSDCSTSSGSADAPSPKDSASQVSHSATQGTKDIDALSHSTSPAPRKKPRKQRPKGLSVGTIQIAGESSKDAMQEWDSVVDNSRVSSSPGISTGSGSNRDSGTPGSRFSDTSTSMPDITHLFAQRDSNSSGYNGAKLPTHSTSVDLEELEQFAKTFKQKRIQLGYTQHDVGAAMGHLSKNEFSQTTISRFEALNLSFKNMCKLKPLLEKWLTDTEENVRLGINVEKQSNESAAKTRTETNGCSTESNADKRRRKKRTSIECRLRTLLEQAFQANQRPNSEELDALSAALQMEREVIRVWYCNRRQKERRLETIGCVNGDSIQQLIAGSAPGLLLYTQGSDVPGYPAHTIPSKVSLKVNEEEALNQSVRTVIVKDRREETANLSEEKKEKSTEIGEIPDKHAKSPQMLKNV